jgi:hypothetical protein
MTITDVVGVNVPADYPQSTLCKLFDKGRPVLSFSR